MHTFELATTRQNQKKKKMVGADVILLKELATSARKSPHGKVRFPPIRGHYALIDVPVVPEAAVSTDHLAADAE